jgi:hypothetical protein
MSAAWPSAVPAPARRWETRAQILTRFSASQRTHRPDAAQLLVANYSTYDRLGMAFAMFFLGSKRRFVDAPMTSGPPLLTDILRFRGYVSKVPISEVTRRLDVFLERAIEREVLNLAKTFGNPIVF